MNPLVLAGLLLVLGWSWLFRRWAGRQDVARKAAGQLLELLLYGDCPRVLGRVLLDLGRSSGRLARQLLAPSLASLVLLAVVVVPLQHYVRWRPVGVGEPFLISQAQGQTLEHDPGLRLDSPPLLAQDSICYWRVVASQPGAHFVRQNQNSGDQAKIWAGSSWAFLKPQQGRYFIYYPERELWLGDYLISWQLGLFCACLSWFGLGLVFKCCWCVLVRQEGVVASRKP